MECFDCTSPIDEIIPVSLCPFHTDASDRHQQLTALLLFGWEVNKRSIYDEEGIEAWVWTEPDGTEHFDISANWDELPDWPDSARAAFAKGNLLEVVGHPFTEAPANVGTAGAAHPVFGMMAPTPEEAFQAVADAAKATP